jgi:hypothetical protein
MPPAAGAVKSPFPQFWTPKKNRDGSGFAFIDFDAMRGRGSPHHDLPFSTYFVLVCLEPLRVFPAQNDRDACGRMIVKRSVVI